MLVVVCLDAPSSADPLADPPQLSKLVLVHKPLVPRMKVRFVHGPVRGACDSVRIRSDGAPEVREVSIAVVDRLDLAWPVGTREQNGERPRKRLDVIGHVRSERAPHLSSDA